MITFTTGNLLNADADAVVNTVNTVGIMGKGIALMFKERFPENFRAYAKACKDGEVQTGRMFVTENLELEGPRWIINFPTKEHWRTKTRPEWVQDGLVDLARIIHKREIKSIAIPPLGCGNGGLDWRIVQPMIVDALEPLNIAVTIFEPTGIYQNVAKRTGVQKLTPARALIADMVRRYQIIGLECSNLEIQKLAWFLNRGVEFLGLEDPLKLSFAPHKYGPYSEPLQHSLNALDGSYLRSERRLPDMRPFDPIQFDESKSDVIRAYLTSGEGKQFARAAEWAETMVDGFQSPFGMELLATVDWLLQREKIDPTVEGIRNALPHWPGGADAGKRKNSLFDDRVIDIALQRLATHDALAIDTM